jgi:urease accessory protein
MFYTLCFGVIVFLCFGTLPAWAHHGMGGGLPQSWSDGLISGLAHPVIGLDHFASILAVGVLGALKSFGILLPIGFILFTTLGSAIHLLGLELPIAELGITASLGIFSMLIALEKSPKSLLTSLLITGAGIFHGYAYGESIFGAETSPLVAYLIGFSLIQTIIALAAFLAMKKLTNAQHQMVGFILLGISFSVIFNKLIEFLLPTP